MKKLTEYFLSLIFTSARQQENATALDNAGVGRRWVIAHTSLIAVRHSRQDSYYEDEEKGGLRMVRKLVEGFSIDDAKGVGAIEVLGITFTGVAFYIDIYFNGIVINPFNGTTAVIDNEGIG